MQYWIGPRGLNRAFIVIKREENLSRASSQELLLEWVDVTSSGTVYCLGSSSISLVNKFQSWLWWRGKCLHKNEKIRSWSAHPQISEVECFLPSSVSYCCRQYSGLYVATNFEAVISSSHRLLVNEKCEKYLLTAISQASISQNMLSNNFFSKVCHCSATISPQIGVNTDFLPLEDDLCSNNCLEA